MRKVMTMTEVLFLRESVESPKDLLCSLFGRLSAIIVCFFAPKD
jgi:hypothetical protein